MLANVYEQVEASVAQYEQYQSDIAKRLAAMEQNAKGKKKGVYNRDVAARDASDKKELESAYYGVRNDYIQVKLTTPVMAYLVRAIESSLTCEDMMKEITIDTEQTRNFNDVWNAIMNILPIEAEVRSIDPATRDANDCDAQAEQDALAGEAEAEAAGKAQAEAEQQAFDDAHRPNEGGEQGEDL